MTTATAARPHASLDAAYIDIRLDLLEAEAQAQALAALPRVSVVIPARNALFTLRETIASVQDQSFENWEIIVVDDRSEDATPALVAALARGDERIRCITGPGRGVSAARNAGVAAARGEVIAFLDADDVWENTKLETHLAHLDANPQVGLSFDRVLFIDEFSRSTGVVSTAKVRGLAAADWLYENHACTASTLVARRAVIAEVGGFDEAMRFAEDLEWVVRIRATSAWQVEGIAQVLTRYRTSSKGASADLAAMQRGWETLMDKVRSYQPALVDRHYPGARAVHLRYLARRAARLGLPLAHGFDLFARALRSSPAALLRQPRRTFGTLASLLVQPLRNPAALAA